MLIASLIIFVRWNVPVHLEPSAYLRYPKAYRLAIAAVESAHAPTILKYSKSKLKIVDLDLMKYGSIRKHFGDVGGGIVTANSRLEQSIGRDERDLSTLMRIEQIARDFCDGDLGAREDATATSENYNDDFHDYRPSHTSLDCPDVGYGKPDRFGSDSHWGFIKRNANNYYIRLMVDPRDTKHPIIGFQCISWG